MPNQKQAHLLTVINAIISGAVLTYVIGIENRLTKLEERQRAIFAAMAMPHPENMRSNMTPKIEAHRGFSVQAAEPKKD